jgi:hypothetical protein
MDMVLKYLESRPRRVKPLTLRIMYVCAVMVYYYLIEVSSIMPKQSYLRIGASTTMRP